MTTNRYDAIVCGGGPAGLAAALWLGRYRRSTLVIDGADQRNLKTHASHGYLTADGCTPSEFLHAARRDVEAYETVGFADGKVTEARVVGDGFELTAGESFTGARLILATGVEDTTPDIPGFHELYGKSIFHCSCCDGYESQGMSVLAIGWGEHAAGFALDLLDWGARVTLVTNGKPFEGDAACCAALERNDVEIIQERVTGLVSDDGRMRGATLESGREVSAERAFFSIEHRPRTDIARALGCALDELGYVQVGPHGETSVEHVYAAGDITPGEQLVQTAAAEGAVAGIACAMSMRGEATRTPAPDPGPDPREELADPEDA